MKYLFVIILRNIPFIYFQKSFSAICRHISLKYLFPTFLQILLELFSIDIDT